MGGGKFFKGSAGIYAAVGDIQRVEGHVSVPGKTDDFVRHKNSKFFVTLEALKARLSDSARREKDYNDIKDNAANRPLEVWSDGGKLLAFPSRWVPTTDPYNDADQLKRWENIADRLVGVPPLSINPTYARFTLKPSEKLGKEITVYFTPSDKPACNIDRATLATIVAKNKSKFKDWPNHEVIEFDDAKKKHLKVVGVNFMKFFVVWMAVKDYEALWKEFNVTALPIPFPAQDPYSTSKPGDPRTVFDIIEKKTAAVVVTSHKIDSAIGKREGTTKEIMGVSATKVAETVWPKDCPSSSLKKKSKAEWLHRMACAYGGLDAPVSLVTSNDPGNLVFGTWECNTHMLRVENFVTQLTKEIEKGRSNEKSFPLKFRGELLTRRTRDGEVTRRDLGLKNPKVFLPKWVAEQKSSWLCFELKYQYVMGATASPLGCPLTAITTFEPWSLYTPLHIEPYMDMLVLNHLKDERYPVRITGVHASFISNASMLYSNMDAMALGWNAAVRGLPSVELSGFVVQNPQVAQPPAETAIPNHYTSRSNTALGIHSPPQATLDVSPPPEGFVLEGDIELFGGALIGRLEKWLGPPPRNVVVGIDPPCIERVTLPGDFHLSMLIPLLEGTPFDNITFRNVVFYHQNYAFDKTKAVGWHFNADWVIEPSCGLLHELLTSVLKVDHPTLSIHASLGIEQGWNTPLNLHSLILEGVFSGLTLSPISGLHLTSIGVRLLGIRGFELDPEPHSTLEYGFGVFGTMELDVPGSVIPLDLNYEIQLAGASINLSAELSGQIWENALGVKNLLLEDVLFTTSFSISSPWSSFAFDVSATFSYLTSQAVLQGAYASGGHFALTAQVDDFGTREIDAIFFTLFSDSLTLPEFDVKIGSAVLSIVSGEGLSVVLRDIDIAGHTAIDVAASFTPSGVSLSGALSSKEITFGDVAIRDAVLEVSFWTSQKQVDLMLGGTLEVEFLDLTVRAAVHLYPGQGGVEWAVVAELDSPKRSCALSDVVSEIKGTFLDFSLKNAVLIAASKDDSPIGNAYPEYTPFIPGVQVSAVIDRIPVLNDLLRQDVSGLVLSAGWSKTSSFSLEVALPAESSIDLGNGIKTTPIALQIRTEPVELAVIAGLRVPVKDSTPLDFSFVLAANAMSASASAEMKGWWVRPLGVDHLKIGPTVALSIEIIYTHFVTTGTPSGFGLAGGLMIGSVEAQMAMNISEDPRRQMLFGSLKRLAMSDVVALAAELVQEDIPKISDNLIKFEELSVYLCPFGVVLGTTTYPSGFSFKADMILFEKRATIECNIDKARKSVYIAGELDNFELGPLSLRGCKGPRAELECYVGLAKQQLTVDGVVSLFEMQAQMYVNMQFLPEPQFKFYILLEFAKIFMFQLDAELIGSLRKNLREADFSLNAKLETDILQYVAQQILEQVEVAKAAANLGLETAQQQVNTAKKAWEGAVTDAEATLDTARQVWESYERDLRSSNQPIIDNYLSQISQLQDEIYRARQIYNSALQSAEGAVGQANRDRATALADANRNVETARRDMDNGINEAQRALDSAKADLTHIFGDALKDIETAQQKVWSLDNQIADVKRTIEEYERLPLGLGSLLKKGAIPGLWATVGSLEVSKAIANTTLDAVRSVLRGAEYLSKEAAIETARGALEIARQTGHANLSMFQDVLRIADETTKFAVDRANDALSIVRTGGQFVAFQGAIEALELFKKANQMAYEAAVGAINGLMQCAAFVAFTTAKATLELVRGSTALLDAANETLKLAARASETVLTILQEVAQFGAQALHIKSIVLSGTLRGIIGVGGGKGRPLSATVKGYLMGTGFDLNVEFDPSNTVAFITAIFKE
ncbi:hypothetical protein B0H13DRAFT_1614506 [Mycena leptocephala]|nr:hypothetical protein B0H13DRAFT_1614506 [Mycena leptocephala]